MFCASIVCLGYQVKYWSLYVLMMYGIACDKFDVILQDEGFEIARKIIFLLFVF